MTGYRLNVSTRTGAELPPTEAPHGPLVFRLELPLALAPTGNVAAAKKRIKGKNGARFVMAKLNADVDACIKRAKAQWPAWDMGVRRWREPKLVRGRPDFTPKGKMRMRHLSEGGRRRLVRVTRYSSSEPDEWGPNTFDACGGKVPADRLKHAGVIRDDSKRWIARDSRWVKAPPGQGCVVVEVFELDPEPFGNSE